ncbi:major facilitator superfamily protein [Roseivivax marinus]|uniref:Major facilitator superfamily protein n=1 Tax=Roseivivax marinus TaxID=1379903 RepID=W4HRG6_9RHOB|nr:MFS transporter [Roseivivax marinus]ETW14600.1 major facilitator superfamily protein [Roseivivax marinus]UMA66168.1 MFS transporter [Roseivivax marinus]
MVQVFMASWPLFFGILLLMVGNGLQGSLMGVRGGAAGFSAFTMSVVISAYFLGFMIASRLAPEMIRRVGHVRVFAALGSLISAALIMFPTLEHPAVWILMRVILGFCFCGVYVTSESWLNNAATNDTRGQALSLYMITQMLGIILAQSLLVLPDASGYLLFVIPSVLVSIAFAPILLAISPTPAFESTKPMNLKELFRASPLGFVGMSLMGAVFALQFGMAAVFASEAQFTIRETSIFVAAFYVGALVFQYPLGWLSDRIDRRVLIAVVALFGGIAGVVGLLFTGAFPIVVAAAVFIGGAANPLYSLLIAYTNDYLEREDMASASAGLMFVNGVGAIVGPLVTGYLMQVVGPRGFFVLIAVPMLCLTAYAFYRMTKRAAPSVDDTGSYTYYAPTGTVVSMEYAAEDEEAEQATSSAS